MVLVKPEGHRHPMRAYLFVRSGKEIYELILNFSPHLQTDRQYDAAQEMVASDGRRSIRQIERPLSAPLTMNDRSICFSFCYTYLFSLFTLI